MIRCESVKIWRFITTSREYSLSFSSDFTISGDETSYKNLNHEVQHVTVIDYLADPSLPAVNRKRVVLVGLNNTASHISEAQLAG